MNNFYRLLLLGLLLSTIAGCKKDNTVPPDFSKITVTDANCLYISDVDSTDWTYDATWSTVETNLLLFTDTNVVISDTTSGFVQVSAICPNPNNGIFVWDYTTEKPCKMKVAVVNTRFEMLYYETNKLNGGPSSSSYDFRFNHAFHQNENYRIYYGFFNAKDSLYYKGHGDFRTE